MGPCVSITLPVKSPEAIASVACREIKCPAGSDLAVERTLNDAQCAASQSRTRGLKSSSRSQ